ncbi:esterase-like activity of phytase family protein [Streptomyces sp. NPDC059740]|uniref:caspase, EACC1-associated type n=1 Tax=Streptomyces sp. NPDC059740 TaxID=3346926 RepID=UPI0036557CA8
MTTPPASVPDPAESAAVLIGVSRYALLEELPAAVHGCLRLHQLLTDRRIWGLPAGRCLALTDPERTDTLLDRAARTAATATDTLVVYYAGHGLVDPGGGKLRLSVTGSTPDRPWSSIAWSDFRRAVLDGSRARRKIVIMDCCFSGLIIDAQSALATEPDILPMTPVEGTYRLAACDLDAVAFAPEGAEHTRFTGALVRLLQHGIPEGGETLSPEDLYRALRRDPEQHPRRQSDGDIGHAPLVHNAAWPAPGKPTTDAPTAPPAAGSDPPQRPPERPQEENRPRSSPGNRPPDAGAPPEDPGRHRLRRILVTVGAVLTAGVCAAATALLTDHTTASPAAGATCSPAAALLGHSDQLDEKSYRGERIAGLSGLSLTGPARGYAVDDKNARLYAVSLGTPDHLDVHVTDAVQLRAPDGSLYADEEFDGEGLVVTKEGYLVASETEPSIGRFSRTDGRLQDELEIPQSFRPGPGSAAKRSELLESLARTPDGDLLYSGLQVPLASESSNQGSDVIRLVRYVRGGPHGWSLDRQLAYPVRPEGQLADIVALGGRHLLTLERTYDPENGNTVRVYRTDVSDTDVSRIPDLGRAPASRLAHKELLFDLAKCPQGNVPNPDEPNRAHPLVTNVEGMALGPELTRGPYRGRRVLYLVSDDNDAQDQVTRFYSLAVDVD